jgi:DNA-binding FrmR family transcriptional regulator
MRHVQQQSNKLKARLRRIRGQMDAVERALDRDVESSDTIQLVAAARGGMNALMAELMANHLIYYVVEPESNGNPREAAEELIGILKTYLK